jgi:chemotaxis protein CheC
VSDSRDVEIDRYSELANIGAGHAAGAFSQLTGHTIVMGLPRVSDSQAPGEEHSDETWRSGVIFQFDGCLSALVAILFRRSMCEAVVHQLLGPHEGYQPPEAVESVLAEVGNILASHVASAIADTLDARLLPSIPMIALDQAEEQLAALAADREGSGDLRVECELRDLDGDLGGLVVLIPDSSQAIRHSG